MTPVVYNYKTIGFVTILFWVRVVRQICLNSYRPLATGYEGWNISKTSLQSHLLAQL